MNELALKLFYFLFKKTPIKRISYFNSQKKFIKKIRRISGIQYKIEYQTFSSFKLLPVLVINIFQVSYDISKTLLKQDNTKIISIVSTAIFHDSKMNTSFSVSLFESNKLYTLEDFNVWPATILSSFIEKQALYHAYTNLTFTINIHEVQSF